MASMHLKPLALNLLMIYAFVMREQLFQSESISSGSTEPLNSHGPELPHPSPRCADSEHAPPTPNPPEGGVVLYSPYFSGVSAEFIWIRVSAPVYTTIPRMCPLFFSMHPRSSISFMVTATVRPAATPSAAGHNERHDMQGMAYIEKPTIDKLSAPRRAELVVMLLDEDQERFKDKPILGGAAVAKMSTSMSTCQELHLCLQHLICELNH